MRSWNILKALYVLSEHGRNRGEVRPASHAHMYSLHSTSVTVQIYLPRHVLT